MADSKEINIYYKESVASMLDISDYLTTAFYRLDKNNDFVAFNMNPDTGYFQLKLAESLIDKEQTPQNTSDALAQCMKEMERTDADLQTLLTSNNKANIKLFNSKYLKLRKAPVSISRDGKVEKWELTFGVELDIYSSLGYGEVSETTGLEDDAVVIQVSGSFISEITYNHLPIIKKEAVIVFPEVEGCPIVYKNLKSLSLVAPFYFTSDGLYRPACKKSIVLQTSYSTYGGFKHLNSFLSKSDSEYFYSIIYSNIKDGILTRKCKIELQRTYRIITIGEGAVHRTKELSINAFNNQFRKGQNIQTYNEGMNDAFLLKMPLNNPNNLEITKELFVAIPSDTIEKEKFFKDNENSGFINYEINYNLQLEENKDYSLLEALEWMLESKATRGVVFLPIYATEVQNISDKHVRLQKMINPEEANGMRIQIQELYSKLESKCLSEVFQYFINKDISKYKDKNIYININTHVYKINSELQMFLDLNGCKLVYTERFEDIKDTEFELLNIYEFYTFYIQFITYSVSCIENTEVPNEKIQIPPQTSIAKAVAGMHDDRLLYLCLNYYLYNKNSKIILSNNSIKDLIHEAGHNLCSFFIHKDYVNTLPEDLRNKYIEIDIYGEYEYDQEGLQSNELSKCYPTRTNTSFILSDPNNLKYLRYVTLS